MAPLLLADLKTALAQIHLGSFPRATIGHRDSAILLLGFVGAFRRAELIEKRIGDIALHPDDGLLIRHDGSIPDTRGSAAHRRLPFGADPLTCPPCAATRWLQVLTAAKRNGGRTDALAFAIDASVHVCVDLPAAQEQLDPDAFLFRSLRKDGYVGTAAMSGDAVNDVVKRRLAAAGLDTRRFGSDSLRTGFIAQAMLDGASAAEIREQTGHQDVVGVERYRVRHAIPHGNAVTGLQI